MAKPCFGCMPGSAASGWSGRWAGSAAEATAVAKPCFGCMPGTAASGWSGRWAGSAAEATGVAKPCFGCMPGTAASGWSGRWAGSAAEATAVAKPCLCSIPGDAATATSRRRHVHLTPALRRRSKKLPPVSLGLPGWRPTATRQLSESTGDPSAVGLDDSGDGRDWLLIMLCRFSPVVSGSGNSGVRRCCPMCSGGPSSDRAGAGSFPGHRDRGGWSGGCRQGAQPLPAGQERPPSGPGPADLQDTLAGVAGSGRACLAG